MRLPSELAQEYSSKSQKIRVLTEYWVNHVIFCPNCGMNLTQFESNQPVADFYCGKCAEEYELKSKNGRLGKKIMDGAYDTMIERLQANNYPNFFFLTYDKSSYTISNFLVIPKYFFVTDMIEKRKPLSTTAKRAGWVGCNIVIDGIPELGKIFYVQNGIPKSKFEVLEKWEKTTFVKNTHGMETKGWLFDVLVCIERLNRADFSLGDIYQFEPVLKQKHPDNYNIQAKIRQQLQFLRDKGMLQFVGRGKYRLNN